jgi:anti-sigma factor RsiW
MTMRRDHLKAQKISRFVDGEGSPEERAIILQHLNQCQRCQKVLAAFRHLDHYLLHQKEERVDPALLDRRILAYVKSKVKSKVKIGACDQPGFCLLGRGFRTVTACLVALGIFLGVLLGSKLAPFLIQEGKGIEITTIFFPQEGASLLLFPEVAFDFIEEGEPS